MSGASGSWGKLGVRTQTAKKVHAVPLHAAPKARNNKYPIWENAMEKQAGPTPSAALRSANSILNSLKANGSNTLLQKSASSVMFKPHSPITPKINKMK